MFRTTSKDNQENAIFIQGAFSKNTTSDIASIVFQNYDDDTHVKYNLGKVSVRDHFGDSNINGVGDLLFSTKNISESNFQERMRILYNGNVGIGTSDPLTPLHIVGNTTIQGNVLPSQTNTYDLGSSSSRFKDLYLSGNTLYIGNKTISLTNDSNFLFNANISLNGLTIQNSNDTLVVKNSQNQTISFGGGVTEQQVLSFISNNTQAPVLDANSNFVCNNLVAKSNVTCCNNIISKGIFIPREEVILHDRKQLVSSTSNVYHTALKYYRTHNTPLSNVNLLVYSSSSNYMMRFYNLTRNITMAERTLSNTEPRFMNMTISNDSSPVSEELFELQYMTDTRNQVVYMERVSVVYNN